MSLISCQRLHIAFGGPPLLENASLQIERGERVGLLGRNGEGKSILMKIPMGSVTPDEGEVIQDAGTRASFVEQQVLEGTKGSLLDVVVSRSMSGTDEIHHAERLCSLLNLLLRELRPQEGSVRHGARLEVAYFDQQRGQVDLGANVADAVANGSDYVTIGDGQEHIYGYLQDFLFSRETASQPVGSLSGGERNRRARLQCAWPGPTLGRRHHLRADLEWLLVPSGRRRV